ncbi:hypothetical protein EDB81DRAFT_672242, partial [Dactylonectria macrodidyma]
ILTKELSRFNNVLNKVFRVTIILAAKFLDDTLMNKHWALISSVRVRGQDISFSLGEINFIEIQLLNLLGWELRITPEDLYTVSEPFLADIRNSIQRH